MIVGKHTSDFPAFTLSAWRTSSWKPDPIGFPSGVSAACNLAVLAGGVVLVYSTRLIIELL